MLIADVTEQVQKLIDEGIDEDLILAGVKSWHAGKSFSAKNIPRHVSLATRVNSAGVKKATRTQRAQVGPDLAAQLALEEKAMK